MGKEIKLICLDLDGTTLKDISNISQRNIDYIRKAYERGIEIALVTGRIFVHGMYFSKILGIPTYIASNNGTYVYDVKKDFIVYYNYFGVDNLIKIYKFVRGKCFNVHYSTIDTIYVNNFASDYCDEENKAEYAMKQVVIDGDEQWYEIFQNCGNKISKITISCDDSEKFGSMLDNVKRIGDFEIEVSWNNTIEVVKKGEGKGNAVRRLKKYLNLDTENVMCVGDSGNDFSMFKESGYKVAMGNAIDELKAISDFVTLDISKDGVAYAIKNLLEQC